MLPGLYRTWSETIPRNDQEVTRNAKAGTKTFVYATPEKLFEHRNVITEAVEVVGGKDDGAAVIALASEVSQLIVTVNGLDDHTDYGVLEYSSPSLGPLYIWNEAEGEEQMPQVGVEKAFDGLVEILETFGVEGVVTEAVVAAD